MKISIGKFINYLAILAIFSASISLPLWKFYFFDLRIALLIISCCLLLFLLFKMVRFSKKCFLISCAFIFLSLPNILMGNNTLIQFFKQFIGISLNALFFYILVKINNYDVKKLFRIYLEVAFIIALIGIIQEISYLLKFRLGYDFNYSLPGLLPSFGWKFDIDRNIGLLRVNSILPEPAFFCVVMIPALFVSIASFLPKNCFDFQKRWKSLVIIASFILTFSLSGYIGIFFVLLLLIYNSYRKWHAFIFSLIFLVLFYIISTNVVLRLKASQSIDILRGKSKIENVNVSSFAFFSNAVVAYNSFRDSPFFGSGLGSHETSYHKYIDKIVDIHRIPSHFLNTKDANSLFLRLLSETGLFGLTIFFIFIVKFYIKRKRDPTDYLWIINNAVLSMFFIKLLRMGNYFADGFFFFFWMYYFSKLSVKKANAVELNTNAVNSNIHERRYRGMKLFFNRYGFYGIIRLSIDVLFSKLVFSRARIIRRPFYMRGKKYIKIGKHFTSGVGLRIDAFPIREKVCIEIGENVQVNDYVHISAVDSIKIGNNVLMGSKVFITDHNHGSYGLDNIHDVPDVPPLKRRLSYIPVEIGDNVWLGESVMILPGVKIGQGSIIGAMSVVTKEIPPFCIAVGSPATVIKKYNFTTNKWEKV